jgi:hypothetical protein
MSGAPNVPAGTASTLLVGPFPNPGASYTFGVVATNALGDSALATGVLIVGAVGSTPSPTPSPTPTPTPTSGCATGTSTTPVVGDFSNITWLDLNIPRAALAAVKMPQMAPGTVTELRTIQSTASDPNLKAELFISPCPGEMNVPAECKTWGTVWGSATYMRAVTAAPAGSGICNMTPGVQYYVTARNVEFDRSTPSCAVTSCLMKLQLNAY